MAHHHLESSWFQQFLILLRIELTAWLNRLSFMIAALIGVAGVTFVLVMLLSVAIGFKDAVTKAASSDVAVVLRAGATSTSTSVLNRDVVNSIANAPGVMTRNNHPMVSREFTKIATLPMKGINGKGNITFRGVQPAAFKIRKGFRILKGRTFKAGTHEAIVGQGAKSQFLAVEPGDRIVVDGVNWRIVGVFATANGVYQSELWTDVAAMQSAYNEQGQYQVAFVQLRAAADLGRFRRALKLRPDLHIKVMGEPQYYYMLSAYVSHLVTSIGVIIAALMGIAATLGALTATSHTVSSRRREIATIRSLGYRRSAVFSAIIADTIIISCSAALGAWLIAYGAFDNLEATTLNWVTFSQMVFHLHVSAKLLLLALGYATLIALLGGIFPSIKISFASIPQEMRQT